MKSIPISLKAFCDKIGVSKGYITNMVSGFGRDVLFRIKSEFPDLSINWLLYGEGEMLNSQSQAVEVGGKQIPFFDVEFEGGYDVMVNDQTRTAASFINVPYETRATHACNHDYIAKSPFRLFKIKQEETRMRVLPVEKLRLLAQTDFPSHYNEYRDFFLLTFYLIGINTVDLADCTRDSIVNGRLEYRRHKTGKIYSIKIEPEAMAIINRYRGRKHLLRWFDKYEDFKAWQGTCNNALSRLEIDGERLQPGLTLYWARYSWATYAAELDVSKDTISEALGHSYGSNITGVYIQFKREKIDVANRRVIDYALKGKTD